ncbi:hypothetical protein [Okeania sp. SIO2B3]|uniref:hypothetical protein n=1 Tax=Okeania sp. SIO2B3 TaxID=2607784 RepID=UPI0013C0A7F6|nr:hypothetical protein [Okeania sp. SIO2B3]NET40668.1 hypothetical protein [Okeania sp. SIO2B3]
MSWKFKIALIFFEFLILNFELTWMMDKVTRQYAQGAEYVRIESYLTHWLRWVISGLGGLLSSLSVGVLIDDAVRCGGA